MAWEEGEEAFCSAEVTSPRADGCSLLRDTTEAELGEKKRKKKAGLFRNKNIFNVISRSRKSRPIFFFPV